MLDGSQSLSEAADHEIKEGLVDPLCNLWVDCRMSPLQANRVALEVCDPSQESFGQKVRTWRGSAEPQVADYVTPAWFDPSMLDPQKAATFLAGGGKFNWLRTMTGPFQLGSHGYAVVEDEGHRVVDRWGSLRNLPAEKLQAKRHPMSRTNRRGCVL